MSRSSNRQCHTWIYSPTICFNCSSNLGHYGRDPTARTTTSKLSPNKHFLPQGLSLWVMQWVHTSLSSGHPGIARTLRLLQNSFWWPLMTKDVVTYVKSGQTCTQSKTPKELPSGLLQPLPIPQRPWSHLSIDFVTDLPLSNGFTTVIVIIDCFSKACRLIPLKVFPQPWKRLKPYFTVFRVYGLSEDIVSDRGTQFTSQVWRAFCKQLDINASLTSGNHPQLNGQVERLNQEIGRYLKSYCSREQKRWAEFLSWAEYAQNSNASSDTNPPFPVVRWTFISTCSRWMDQAQWEGVGQCPCLSTETRQDTGQQTMSPTPSLPTRTTGLAFCEGPQAAAIEQEAQPQVCWPI